MYVAAGIWILNFLDIRWTLIQRDLLLKLNRAGET